MSNNDTPPKSNPAGRLWHLVQDGKALHNKRVPEALCALFNCSPDDRATQLRGLLNFVDLTEEVERLVNRVPKINPRKHLAWTTKVKEMLQHQLSIQPGHSFSNILGPFDDNAMGLLSICSDHLEEYCREPVADEAGVRRLLDEALRLHAEIASAELELPVQQYMLRHLQLVIEALYDYRTKGFEALWNGLSAIKGHTDLAGLRVGGIPKKAADSALWRKVGIVVGGLVGLVDTAQRAEFVLEKGQGVRQLLTIAVPALPPAPSTPNGDPDGGVPVRGLVK